MCSGELRDPVSPKLRLRAGLLAGDFVEVGRIFSLAASCSACFRSLGDLQLFASLSSPLSPRLGSATVRGLRSGLKMLAFCLGLTPDPAPGDGLSCC